MSGRPRVFAALSLSLCLSLSLSLCLCLCLPLHAHGARWQQTAFVISNWVDPVVPMGAFEAAYRDFAQANFTLLLGGFGATNATQIAAQLRAAEAVGIRVAAAGAGGKANVSWLPDPYVLGRARRGREGERGETQLKLKDTRERGRERER